MNKMNEIRENKGLFINENKILDFLHNDLKLSLVAVNEQHQIIVKSSISNLKTVIDFVEPFNYYVSFIGLAGSIYINP